MSALKRQTVDGITSELKLAPTGRTHFTISKFGPNSAAVVAGIAAVLLVELVAILWVCGGHLIYLIEAPYTDLALAHQIQQGHYGIVAGESAAPSSSILYPVLLAAFASMGLGTVLPLAINICATIAAGIFALLLADECGLSLPSLGPARLFVLSVVIALALNLAGLAFTGLEHSLHLALSVAYLLGLVRFVRRGRADTWWFICIIVQPLLRFEAAAMLVADALIFVGFRKYGYAALTILIGAALVGGYSLFLHAIGLPLLPSSVLARSDWSQAAVASHSGILTIASEIARNFYKNVNTFGAAQILGGVALAWLWLGTASPFEKGWRISNSEERIQFSTALFLTIVSFAQLIGGKLGWVPPRYEAYVLAVNLCGLAVIYRGHVAAWCAKATWPRVSLLAMALLLPFAGYASQTMVAPSHARKEFLGPYQLHRFATEFYRRPVAIDQLGYVNVDNPNYVLDLSGLASETVRRYRASDVPVEWMDSLMEAHDVGLAIIQKNVDPSVPAGWTPVGELSVAGSPPDDAFVFYARSPANVTAIRDALARFESTLPRGSSIRYPGE
jgi:hypothetical protein